MNNNHHNNGSFGNGFLFGLIVGAALVFLLMTKKGKRILKLISEEGFDNLSNIVDEYVGEEDEESEANGEVRQEIQSKPKKRFFRRSK